jgi:dihydroxy-acid dehydratase
VDVDVFALFNELGGRIPVLSAVRPNGPDSIEAFEAAGAAQALLKQLAPLLNLDVITVTGRTLRENLAYTVVRDPEVIRPLSRPFSDKPPIVILRGSLAPESAVVKLGLRGPERRAKLSGPAIVFEDGSAAIEAIRAGRIKPGHVLVVRGMGP